MIGCKKNYLDIQYLINHEPAILKPFGPYQYSHNDSVDVECIFSSNFSGSGLKKIDYHATKKHGVRRKTLMETVCQMR
jgi:hypothetical protein